MVISGGLFGSVAGLPLHPLVIHASIVLIPLVAIGALVMSYLPSFSRRYGKLILFIALFAQLSLFLAKVTGEAFEEILDKDMGNHAELGEIAPFITLPMVALIYLRWRLDRSGATVGSVWVRRLTSLALIVASLASIAVIVLVGHSGAESVWGWIDKL
ncbi:unannotated protein [freshwater metagenome]|jgi:hypothetical protein|uniref:Unannotated protein n=1 Tax=freshwater metagenome TaxID=449393 RepID=A0A6J6KB54_9ZZZZ|nr:hypothetical protein [Actinomycetota bacterium]